MGVTKVGNRTRAKMPIDTRPKMPIEERAKQFNPFAAVTGLDKALRKKEHEMGLVEKRELSEDATEELDRALALLHDGDVVTAEYYSYGEYLTLTGPLSFASDGSRTVLIGDEPIAIEDLVRIGK